MINFWFIPIMAFLIGGTIAGGAIYEKYTVIIPKAEAELLELKAMSCSEIKIRNFIGSYKLPINGVFARDKIDTCISSENAIKQLERERMAKLLADPNSQESLEKKLLEIIHQDNTHRTLLLEHTQLVEILQGNVTHFENEFDITLDKMDDLGYLDNNGCIEMIRVNDVPIGTCK